MAKYIDADLLRKEIEFAKSVYSHPNRFIYGVADACRQDGRAAMCDDILEKIDSLQPEQQEESIAKEAVQLVFEEKLTPFKDGNQWSFLLGNNIQEGVCGFGDTILDAAIAFYKDYSTTRIHIGELKKTMEQPEVDLEVEIEKYYYDNFAFISSAHNPTKDIVSDIANHFFELGQRDAANKFDEIEYNRQRAGQEMLDKTLDVAAEEYAYNNWEDNDYHTGASEGLPFDAIGHTANCFKAGAKWMAGQGVTKEAVIGMATKDIEINVSQRTLDALGLCPGDKVIVQIRKKEESK